MRPAHDTYDSYPTVITIDNHRACNARCRMCPTQNVSSIDGAMSDATFDELSAQVSDFAPHLEFVQFGVHGEPLLDRQIATRVRRLVASGVRRVWIATNGAAMTPARADQLL